MEQLEGIAVIGMSCRFPGAKNIEAFWRNLQNGIEAVSFFTDDQLARAGVDSSDYGDPDYVKAASVVEDIDCFDHGFFGYAGGEAARIDPQQRMFLECAWECMEDGGYEPLGFPGAVGVFGGMRYSGYLQYMLSQYRRVGTASSFQALIGTDKDYLTNRVSYKLNLKGPSVTIQTACSTSLVAVHMACESLRNGECDMALAGGVALSVPQEQGYFYQEDMIFSPDGHCRAFDADAGGIVGGNGAGIVLLKPLPEAVRDRDHIYAVVRGSAVNNDGQDKAGYTAPSIEGQATVISEAMAMAGAHPEEITYVEAHGTATPIGDPMEIEALNKVYRADTDKRGYCALGSVKSNLGHLDTAAGIASFIKTVLALDHEKLPPSLHFKRPNPRIDFGGSPFFVNTELTGWQRNGTPLTAGVSSFGIGGTNAHVILSEAPGEPSPATPASGPQVLPFSARGEAPLRELLGAYQSFFQNRPEIPLGDVAHTLSRGRAHFPHRLAVAATSPAEAAERIGAYLSGAASRHLFPGASESGSPPAVVFLFTGQGAQYPGMGRTLYEGQPVFKEALDRCAEILRESMDTPLQDILFGDRSGLLDQTRYTQPALFALEYALARMWAAWGVVPAAALGHSVGEYVAACLAGVFSLDEGLTLVAERARFMQAQPDNGGMLAVFADEDTAMKAMAAHEAAVSVAAFNGPELTVLSGSKHPLGQIAAELEAAGISHQWLKVSHAFHSPLMEPVLADFSKIAGGVDYQPASFEIASNLTGKLAAPEELGTPAYWCRHLRQPVRFAAGIEALAARGYTRFLEIGPHPVLSGMARPCLAGGNGEFMGSLHRGKDSWETLNTAVGNLYAAGATIQWDLVWEGRSLSRVSLPTYPFERHRHWIQETTPAPADTGDTGTVSIMDAMLDGGREALSSYELSDERIEALQTGDSMMCRTAGRFVIKALTDLGAPVTDGEGFSVESLLFQTPVLPRYARWLGCLLEGLSGLGMIGKTDDEYTGVADGDAGDTATQGRGPGNGEILSGNDELTAAIQAHGQGLAARLSGEPATLDAGPSGIALDDAMHRDYVPLKLGNTVMARLVEGVVNALPGNIRLNVAEIGGTGTGPSQWLTSRLPSDRARYVFSAPTDPGKAGAEERLSGVSFARVRVRDIQESADAGADEEPGYDLVVARNGLDAVRHVGEALEHIRDLLLPGGLFIMAGAETCHLLRDLLFGDTCVEIEDEETRDGYGGIKAAQWIELLQSRGFSRVEILPLPLGDAFVLAALRATEGDDAATPAFRDETGLSGGTHAVAGRPTGHPLLGHRFRTALPVFENTLANGETPFTAGVRLAGETVLSHGACLEAVSAAAREISGNGGVRLTDLSWDEPLFIPDSGARRILQVTCAGTDPDAWDWSVFSRKEGEGTEPDNWRAHGAGRAATLSPAAEGDGPVYPEIPGDRELMTLSGDEVYAMLSGNDMDYDAPWQRITSLAVIPPAQDPARHPPEPILALGRISAGNGTGAAGCGVDPALLEGVLQTALATAMAVLPEADRETSRYDVKGVKSTWVPGDGLPDEFQCRVACVPDPDGESGGFSADCRILDSADRVLGELTGIRIAPEDRDAFQQRLADIRALQDRDGTGASEDEGQSGTDAGGILATLHRTADEDERYYLLEDYLIATFSELLRIDADDISPDDDFIQLGVDSLQFLELNQMLMRDLKVRMTPAEAFETPYIHALAEGLLVSIQNRDPAESEIADDSLLDPVAAVGGEITADLENRHQPFDLTNVQYAYWIGRSGILDLGDVSCHFYFEVERDSLDLDRFNLAWNRVVARHDMLRSVFLPEGLQKILPEVPQYAAAVNDMTGLDPGVVEERLLEIRYEKSHQVISSETWPMFDILVSLLPGNRVRIHFSIELLNVDVMSIQIIFNEVDQWMRDPDYQPEPLAISFRDYVLAEKALRETPFYEQSRKYWIDMIPDMPPAPELPLAKSPAEVTEQRFTSKIFHFEQDTWGRLKARAADKGITPSGVLLGAYNDVLAAWSRHPRFIISLTQFNRIPFHPDVNRITGDFTSIMIMPQDARCADTFLERARRTQTDLLTHMDYRYFDGVRVIREMTRGRRAGAEALIPVVYTSILGIGDQSQEIYPWGVLGEVGFFVSQTPQVWLDNQVSEVNGRLLVSWDVIEEMFPDGMLDDMLAAYEQRLLSLLADDAAWDDPDPGLVPDRHIALYEAANATDAPVSGEHLHTLFTGRAAEQPDHPAIIATERTLSYGELRGLAGHTARRLRDLGAAPNRLVAVVMEKGWEQVVGVMGILMSGAAYLPVEPDTPPERLRWLLENGEVTIVVTQARVAEALDWPDSVRTLIVGDISGDTATASPPENVNQPEDIAYVIYTSGSTGTPKGVVIDHRGAVNTLLDVNSRFGIDAADRVLALSALNFDLSVFDIFGTLAAGGTIVMPEPEKAKDPAHWWDLMVKQNVTVWNSVPVLMRMLTDHVAGISGVTAQSLRLAMLSGDWIPLDLPDHIRSLFSDARVVSLGGATEASIWSILYPVETVSPDWKSIPYGRPMKNQHVYVLDDTLGYRPVWVPGEIYIGGVGLAKGYWKDPEKTDRSFLIHPATGERIYRTGDIGRYLPDGTIEFLGREDYQVKVRGYRIELGEIEAAVTDFPDVADAVVDVAGESGEDRKIMAYVVPSEDGPGNLFCEHALDRARAGEHGREIAGKGNAAGRRVPDHLDPGTFPVFWEFMERLTVAAVCRIFEEMGVFHRAGDRLTPDELMKTGAVRPQFGSLMGQWLALLTEAGLLANGADGAYEAVQPVSERTLSRFSMDDTGDLSVWRDTCAGMHQYFQSASPVLAAILRGDVAPAELFLRDDVLFTAESMEQFNPVREYGAAMARAVIEAAAAPPTDGAPVRILELGTRVGGMTADILDALPPEGISYTLTDTSPYFLDRAREELAGRAGIDYRLFDPDTDPAAQGFAPHAYDLIIADNTLHRAVQIHHTLGYLKDLLGPGGRLLIHEGTRNSAMQLVTVALFEEGFTRFEDHRARTCLPLLSHGEWESALREAGFGNLLSFPDRDAPAHAFGMTVMLAQGPLSVRRFDPSGLADHLGARLPAYMLPAAYMPLASIPLSPNGKIDRNALPKPDVSSRSPRAERFQAPRTETERMVAEIWGTVLKIENPGIHDEFIAAGGDSLQATQVINMLREKCREDIPLRILFGGATIESLAGYIEEITAEAAEQFEEGAV